MTEQAAKFESLLRKAIHPVDPPTELQPRLAETFGSIVEAAADELEAWELSSMKNPRNWFRPMAALIAGSGAALGLMVIRTRSRRQRRRAQNKTSLHKVTAKLRRRKPS